MKIWEEINSFARGRGRITFHDFCGHDESFWRGEFFPFNASQVVILTRVCLPRSHK